MYQIHASGEEMCGGKRQSNGSVEKCTSKDPEKITVTIQEVFAEKEDEKKIACCVCLVMWEKGTALAFYLFV